MIMTPMSPKDFERIDAMTVAHLFEMLDPDAQLKQIQIVLGLILGHAAVFYDNECKEDLCGVSTALGIAEMAVDAEGDIDEMTAGRIANRMAVLVYELLQQDGTETWNAELLSRLGTIRDTHPISPKPIRPRPNNKQPAP
jgi:hypothetical protein